jgi:KUP system potassium uptake protein
MSVKGELANAGTAPPASGRREGRPRGRAPTGGHRRSAVAGLTLAALGVVFGDIGTSPLYAIQTVFAINGGVVRPTRGDVFGVISLVFWAITLIVSIKYVVFILRADNDGEGGIMALAALVQRAAANVGISSAALVALGVFGASLFYGDSVITPAISVLSAVEGLKVAAPGLADLVVPLALGILTGLFAIQRWGTATVGRLFGPVMVLWFAAIGVAGSREVLAHPDIVKGLSPSYALGFVFDHPGVAFVAMGAVVLAITGAEALYADMGHFGRRPIRRAWFGLVFPALTLNYLGQTGLILHHPSTVENPFFLLLPHWARIPMVFLATAATVIASQAVISGAFSISRQSARLGFLPRLTVRHTSEHEVGQVYVPAVNWGLFIAVVGIVLGFRSSERLGSAYGVAVSGTFVITTVLFLTVARWRWRWPVWTVVLAAAVFLTAEVTFFAANLSKIHHGGWLPLVIGLGVFTVMTTWNRGREIVTANRTREEGLLQSFIEEIRAMDPPLVRVPGTAVFPSPSLNTTPLAMRATVEHINVLHSRAVIISAQSVNIPHVPRRERVTIDDLGYVDDNITHVTARFGFQDEPNIPDALRLAQAKGLECDLDLHGSTYFLSRINIKVTDAPGMSRWRKQLFVAVARNAASPVEYFGLPDERTITMGSQIPL